MRRLALLAAVTVVAILSIAIPLGAALTEDAAADAAEETAYALCLEAYPCGYPRVEMARLVHNETDHVAANQAISAPLNCF